MGTIKEAQNWARLAETCQMTSQPLTPSTVMVLAIGETRLVVHADALNETRAACAAGGHEVTVLVDGPALHG